MKTILKYMLMSFLTLASSAVLAQDLDAVRRERQAVMEQIKKTDAALSANQKSVQTQLYRYNVLNDQIKESERYLNMLNAEYNKTRNELKKLNAEYDELNRQLQLRKDQYANLVRHLYTRLHENDKLMFIFSAKDFGQSLRRIRYLNEYSRHERQQAEEIRKRQQEIDSLKEELEKLKVKQAALVAEQQAERDQLKSERSKQNKVVQDLRKRSRALQTELNAQKQKATKLNRKIEEIIAEENRRSAGNSASSKAVYVMNVNEQKLASEFGKNKGQLPFPLNEPGTIVVHFGQQKHQDMKYVQTNSSGIDIQTAPGASARAIFNGTVTKVFSVQGTNFSIIVRHGNYLTVYSNIEKVSVKAGQTVKTGETLGTVYVDKSQNNLTVMHFQIWKDLEKLDPELWIKRIK